MYQNLNTSSISVIASCQLAFYVYTRSLSHILQVLVLLISHLLQVLVLLILFEFKTFLTLTLNLTLFLFYLLTFNNKNKPFLTFVPCAFPEHNLLYKS